jgi:superfamily II DNA or RNA helicase
MVDQSSKGTPVEFGWVGDEEHDRRAAAKGKPDWAGKQRAWVDQFYDAIVSSRVKGAIAAAPTSFGKTVSSSKLISLFKRTTMIIVHKDFLIDQWKQAAYDWLQLNPEDVGVVQGPKCEFEGRKLVIAMVESLTSGREYPKELYDWAGMIMIDEVHRFGARVWSQIMKQFTAEVRAGVSATPRRRDGLQKLFTWGIGPVKVQVDDWYMKPKVYQIAWPTWLPENLYCQMRTDRRTGKQYAVKTYLAKMINLIAGLPKYNEWLVREIEQAAKKGRKILVLSDRREHLKELRASFDTLTGGVFHTAFYWGSMKKAEAEAAESANVLFGTFGKAKEGLDIPDMDTLYLTTPRADVEQDIGRVLRVHPDKKEPLVVDIVHTGMPTAERFSQSRMRLYKSKDYDVTRVGM